MIEYILDVEEVHKNEFQTVLLHTDRLKEKIVLMIDVIRAQQSYAGTNYLTEKLDLRSIADDTLTLQVELLGNYRISVTREYDDVPDISVQKIKLAHILINLIVNAKDAMSDIPDHKRKLHIKIENSNKWVYLRFRDTGNGIEQQNLKKIFTHGFSTGKKGHGFGLNTSAIFMEEMNGSIWAESEGPGKGATIVLKFAK